MLGEVIKGNYDVSMRGALKEELTTRFPLLFDDLGFRIAEHDFSYGAMAASRAVIESDVLRVRFENDRGGVRLPIIRQRRSVHR